MREGECLSSGASVLTCLTPQRRLCSDSPLLVTPLSGRDDQIREAVPFLILSSIDCDRCWAPVWSGGGMKDGTD